MDGNSGILQARAERALMEALPRRFGGRFPRIEVLSQDGTMILFREPETDEADPIAILRRNGETPGARLFAPVVVDPETGLSARRYIIPYRVWAAPGALGPFLEGKEKEPALPAVHGALRLAKGIPEGASTYRFGRSARFSLLLGEAIPVLATQIFPGGLVASDLRVTEERCVAMAWVLLARSGVSGKPYPFHILRHESFFQVERAAIVPSGMDEARGMGTLANELLRGAEEDRKVLTAMLATAAPWEPFFQRQGRDCDDPAMQGTGG